MPKEELTVKMAALVSQYRDSGQTLKTFALAHGISEAKLIYWIKKLSKVGPKSKKGSPSSNFVPLKVASVASGSRDHLLIRLPSGVEIQIPL